MTSLLTIFPIHHTRTVVVLEMAYSAADPSQAAFAASKVRSQSDSDLLNPTPASNGVYDKAGSLKRNTSMDDMNTRGKRRNFLYKLVRPWKWRSRRKSKIRTQGGLEAFSRPSSLRPRLLVAC